MIKEPTKRRQIIKENKQIFHKLATLKLLFYTQYIDIYIVFFFSVYKQICKLRLTISKPIVTTYKSGLESVLVILLLNRLDGSNIGFSGSNRLSDRGSFYLSGLQSQSLSRIKYKLTCCSEVQPVNES